jgi:uncharacterized tellurite resistance protein B-like protein
MAMRDRLETIYATVAVHATADSEHEAAVELLLLMMLMDNRVSDGEMDEIRTIAADSGWESDTFSFDQHLGPAMAKVRAAALSDAGVDALVDDIDRRITSTVLRASLFSAARDVAGVDRSLSSGEEQLLAQLAARFA